MKQHYEHDNDFKHIYLSCKNGDIQTKQFHIKDDYLFYNNKLCITKNYGQKY